MTGNFHGRPNVIWSAGLGGNGDKMNVVPVTSGPYPFARPKDEREPFGRQRPSEPFVHPSQTHP